MIYYALIYSIAIFLCLLALIYKSKECSILSTDYFRFLLIPWKLVTFIVSACGIVVIAPWTGDPTWDYYDASLMSLLTYLTAPWSLGILYQTIFKRNFSLNTYIALCFWLLSASWSYDLYNYFKHGFYPESWFNNLLLSSVLYISAGLFWNLDWTPSKKVHFSFMVQEWPNNLNNKNFSRIILLAIPFMVIAAAIILFFLDN